MSHQSKGNYERQAELTTVADSDFKYSTDAMIAKLAESSARANSHAINAY